MINKIYISATSMVVAVAMVFGTFAFIPQVAIAADSEQERAELIESLKQQIVLLQEKIQVILDERGITLDEVDSSSSDSDAEYTSTLQIGSRDSETNGEVTKLQKFLHEQGVYPENIVSGYFGALTGDAVARLKDKYHMPFEDDDKEVFTQADFVAWGENKGMSFDQVVYAATAGVTEGQGLVSYGWQYSNSGEEELEIGTSFDVTYKFEQDTGMNMLIERKDSLVNQYGSVMFRIISELIQISRPDGGITVYSGVVAADEDNFIYEDLSGGDLDDLIDGVGDWFRQELDEGEVKESEEEVLLNSFITFESLGEFASRYEHISLDKDSREFDPTVSQSLGYDVYEYELEIDLENVLEMISEELGDKALELHVKSFGYEDVEDFQDNMRELEGLFWVNNRNQIVAYGIFADLDYQSEEGDLDRLELFVVEEFSPRSVQLDLSAPESYSTLK